MDAGGRARFRDGVVNFDPITERLRAAQAPIERYLWIPEDAITFTPRVCPTIFGDGRALLAITTIHNRPAHWIVRIGADWRCHGDYDRGEDGEDVAERSEELICALEEALGRRDRDEYRWEVSGRGWRLRELETGRFVSEKALAYPIVDARDGWSWWRLRWPPCLGFNTEPHPFDERYDLLAADVAHLRAPTTPGD